MADAQRREERFQNSRAAREPALCLQKRHVRVTVKYRRAELQKRLQTEQWIESALQQLYAGAEEEMPEEMDIDDLLVLQSDEERAQKVQELLQNCRNDTQGFVAELLQMLHGLQKQEELQKESVAHPCIHSYPHHHSNDHGDQQHQRAHQTL